MTRAKFSLVFSIGLYPFSSYTKYSLALAARAYARGDTLAALKRSPPGLAAHAYARGGALAALKRSPPGLATRAYTKGETKPFSQFINSENPSRTEGGAA